MTKINSVEFSKVNEFFKAQDAKADAEKTVKALRPEIEELFLKAEGVDKSKSTTYALEYGKHLFTMTVTNMNGTIDWQAAFKALAAETGVNADTYSEKFRKSATKKVTFK